MNNNAADEIRGENGLGDDGSAGAEPGDPRIVAADSAGESTVEQLQRELADAQKSALLHQADLENYRRRTRREMQNQEKYATIPLLSGLLDVVDNLERALGAVDGDGDAAGLAHGVEIVATQLKTILDQNDCKKIDALGQPFDPNLHEAVQMQPSNDYPENHVMYEVRTGYLLHDRVVRPSQVFVSTGPAN